MKKVQLPVVGGIRKTIIIPDATLATTLQGYAGSTLTIAQLRAILGVTPATNTGNGNIGPPGQGAAPKAPQQTVIIWSDGDGGGDSGSGPPGQQGAPGTNGATGAAGPAGPAVFLTAEPGEDVWPAVPGNPGPAGVNGTSGGPGPAGPAVMFFAEDGPEGDSGPPGPSGAAGAAGASSNPFNITPDTHPVTPTGVGLGPNDEFEGAALDTTGTRYAGATAWTWFNQHGASATLSQGAVQLLSSVQSSAEINMIGQTIPGGTGATAFEYRAKFRQFWQGQFNNASIVLYESGTGKAVRLTVYDNGGAPSWDTTEYNSLTSQGGSLASGTIVGAEVTLNALAEMYFRVVLSAGSYFWSISRSGYDNTFVAFTSFAVNAFLTTAADTIGLGVSGQNASFPATLNCDWFRRLA